MPAESPQARGARSKRARRGEVAPPLRALNPHRRGAARVGISAKEKLADAFTKMGDVAGLVKWAKKNPTEFYRLWARLIPKEDSLLVANVGVEDLLRQLDEQAAPSGDALSVVEGVGAALGLPAPPPDYGTEVA